MRKLLSTLAAIAAIAAIVSTVYLFFPRESPLTTDVEVQGSATSQVIVGDGNTITVRVQNPAATDSEFDAYVSSKLGDLQERFEALAEANDAIRALIEDTREAVNAGRFDDAEANLAKAEETRRVGDAVAEARELSDIRLVRGETALLNDDPLAAAEHFRAAIEYVDSDDPENGGVLRRVAAYRLLEHGERRGGEGARLAVEFFERDVDYWDTTTETAGWAMAQSNLCVARQSYGEKLRGEQSLSVLQGAIEACRAALRVLDKETNLSQWAGIQGNLGNALMAFAERRPRQQRVDLVKEAMSAQLAARDAYIALELAVEQTNARINLSNTQATLAALADGTETAASDASALLDHAIEGYRAALDMITKRDQPGHWALLHANLGGVLVLQRRFPEAFAAYREALTVYNLRDYPVAQARARRNLGAAMVTYGLTLDVTDGWEYLQEAIEELQRALETADPEDARELATTHKELGRADGAIGVVAGQILGPGRGSRCVSVSTEPLRFGA